LRLGHADFAPAFHLAAPLGFLLRLPIKTLQLALALLPRLLQLQLRFRAARALVVDRLRSGRLYALPVVELLLPLLLLDLELLSRLLLADVAGRLLRGALLLLHAELERILLLLPLQLMLLQCPRSGVFCTCSSAGEARAGSRHHEPKADSWNESCECHKRAPAAARRAKSYPSKNRGLRHQCD
jgi:hypothetical protein